MAQRMAETIKQGTCPIFGYSIGSANSSVGTASDCSSESCRFKPNLEDINTSLTQLVECQPHELKEP